MLHFLKKWHYHYKQDKDARACTAVNGQNYMDEINEVTEVKTNFRKVLYNAMEGYEEAIDEQHEEQHARNFTSK